MTRIDPESILHPVGPDVVRQVAKTTRRVGSAVEEAVASVKSAWSPGMSEAIQVSGEPGAVAVGSMISGLATSTVEQFKHAMHACATALSEEVANLTNLRSAGDRLRDQADQLNGRWQHAEIERLHALDALRATNGWDPLLAINPVESEMTALAAEVKAHNAAVEEAERRIADKISGISGGTRVVDRWGREVTAARSWGTHVGTYPGGPTYRTDLTQDFTNRLTTIVTNAITALSTMDPDEAKKWLEKRPGLESAVGLLPASTAAALYDELASTSAPAGVPWHTDGPLNALFQSAPLLVGNLPGIPASVKNAFNREGLRQLLNSGGLGRDQKDQLSLLDETLRGEGAPGLYALHLDTDGSPRASVAYGDVDTADQVTTLTHGIRTDLANVDDWARSAHQLAVDTDAELAGKAHTAVVVYMEWDSGGATNVFRMDRPAAGAERLTTHLEGISYRNPSAQQTIVAHSLGSTMASQAIANHPGLVSHLYTVGSAGIAHRDWASLGQQMADGTLRVSVAEAPGDPWARIGKGFWSSHPTEPQALPGAEIIRTEAGFVPGFGEGLGEHGFRTPSHDAHGVQLVPATTHTGPYQDHSPRYAPYEAAGQGESAVDYSGDYLYQPTAPAAGYLEPESTTYKRLAMSLVDDVLSADR